MQLFYEPEFSHEKNFLNEEESRHCAKVLRHKQGDVIYITNGKGNQFEAKIIKANPKRCEFEILQTTTAPGKNYHIHVGIAPTKNNDRIEWFIEKSTEIGIDEITPILCHYSDRHKLRLDRLEKKAISAMKQSLKSILPKINPIVKFNQWISNHAQNPQKFIAHYQLQNKSLHKEAIPGHSYIILIGPEGDFADEEIKYASDLGFIPVNLGTSRLRTETAALIACHTLNLINQE